MTDKPKNAPAQKPAEPKKEKPLHEQGEAERHGGDWFGVAKPAKSKS